MLERIDVVIWQDETYINVSGFPDGLEQLAEALTHGADAQYPLEYKSCPCPASSSETFFTTVEIRITDGSVVINARGDTVVLSGSAQALWDLSCEIRNFSTSPWTREMLEILGDEASKFPGVYHLHVEHLFDHSILAAESEPMILYVRAK